MTSSPMGIIPSEVNMASLRLFNVVPEAATCEPKDSQYKKLSAELLTKYQVAVLPSANHAIEDIYSFAKSTRLTADQLNSTFFRSWEDVTSRTELELKMEQILHYCTTFFVAFQSPWVYIPAEKVPLDIEVPKEGWKLRQFGAASLDQIVDQCLMLLRGGTALTQETIMDIFTICVDWLKMKINPDEVKNRDTRVITLSRLIKEDLPLSGFEPEEMIKAVLLLCNVSLPVVKDRKTIEHIKESGYNASHALEVYGVDKLATVFQRYKCLLLALKVSNKANCKIINHISKRSKALHIPLASNPLNTACVRIIDIDRDARWLNSATIPAKLRALNSCKLAMEEQNGFKYNIRNGKIWAKDHTRPPREEAAINFHILLDNLRASLGAKFMGKVVYIPSGIEYGLPVSDLQMLGNITFGTRITVPTSQPVAVGIYWKLEYRCSLLDLSGVCDDGICVSWCTKFKHKSFAHSGDMTCPGEHGATEYILAEGLSGEVDETIALRASCWFGCYNNWQYDIIIGTADDITHEYMMHPDNRIATFRYKANKATCDIGYLTRNSEETTFMLAPGASSSHIENEHTDKSVQKASDNHAKHMLKHGLTLNSFLELLGARVVHAKDETVDIDLGLDNISKDFFNVFYR